MNYLVKGVLLILLLASASLQAATVLLYHHVSETSPKSTSVTTEQFAAHLALIEELGLVVVPLTTITNAISKGQAVDDNWVAITFDDGYRNVYDNALPLLKQRNWPFTVFVNPDMVKPSKLYMDSAPLKELTHHRGEIANHTLAHENLIKNSLSIQEIEQNLLKAERTIAANVGHSLKMLAYPFGEYNDRVKAVLKAHGFIGFAQHSGAINESSDLHALTRFPANGIYANPKTLKTKLRSLPFDVKSMSPSSTSPENLQPKWLVSLNKKDFYQSQLSCFISGQSQPVKPKWQDKLTFSIQAEQAIGTGRIKYNCTAPSISKPGQYYWISKLWIRV